LRDHAAHHHAAEILEAREDCRLHRAAHIFPIDINALRHCRVQLRVEIAAMIKTGVKAQFLHHKIAFLGATRDANNLAAPDLRNLPSHLPNST
jgi:hypothetical protein